MKIAVLVGSFNPFANAHMAAMKTAVETQQLLAAGYNPSILNLASAGRPGGGYDMGYGTQEENLCQFAAPRKLKCIRDCGVPPGYE